MDVTYKSRFEWDCDERSRKYSVPMTNVNADSPCDFDLGQELKNLWRENEDNERNTLYYEDETDEDDTEFYDREDEALAAIDDPYYCSNMRYSPSHTDCSESYGSQDSDQTSSDTDDATSDSESSSNYKTSSTEKFMYT